MTYFSFNIISSPNLTIIVLLCFRIILLIILNYLLLIFLLVIYHFNQYSLRSQMWWMIYNKIIIIPIFISSFIKDIRLFRNLLHTIRINSWLESHLKFNISNKSAMTELFADLNVICNINPTTYKLLLI